MSVRNDPMHARASYAATKLCSTGSRGRCFGPRQHIRVAVAVDAYFRGDLVHRRIALAPSGHERSQICGGATFIASPSARTQRCTCGLGPGKVFRA
jgi:hypothetical protein